MATARTEVLIDLTAALVAVTVDQPRVLTIGAGQALPSGPLESAHRSLQTGMRAWIEQQKYLLAGLLKCGCCGSAYTLISKRLLGCAAARNKGTCSNRLNIRVDALEASVVSGLRTHLMDPMLFKEFCDEFTREVNRLPIEKSASLHAAKAELPRITRELDKLVQRVLDTDDLSSIKAYEKKMREIEARKADLETLIASMDEPLPLLHPNMAEIYRSRVAALHEALLRDETKAEAAETIRALVDQVVLVPENGELAIMLKGDLSAMLSFTTDKKKPGIDLRAGHSGDSGSPGSLVAGTRNHFCYNCWPGMAPAFRYEVDNAHQLAA